MRVFGANGPTGAMPDAAAWSPDGKLIYVAEGGLNAVAVVDAQRGVILGHIPTGWYPAAVAISPDGDHLYISSDKGLGFGPNGVDHPAGSNYATNKRLVGGTFQDVPLTCLNLRVTTSYVRKDNGFFPSAPEGDSTSDGDGGVIPAAFGTPSSKIKHVVMILKENRTFDQILGDMPGVERDQRLNDLGGKITPNHHAIAKRYATGDNMYHIVLDSTDGHWVSGTGQENEFDLRVDPSEINGVFHGGDQISGTAPENEPIGGMIWNHYKRKNISFKIWGEGLYLAGLQTTNPALSAPNPDPNDPNSLLPISNPATDLENPVQYPTQVPNGTNGDSDEKRADDYVNNSIPLMEKAGMPQFSLVYLPNDHTNGFSSGSLTPSSWVAINDHALGRVIEGLSKSTLWKDTAVFVVEDDTQGGRDHVDAERVLSLTAGPYVRQGYISHVHHSIYSILKTMDLVLGVPPTSVQEASATSMADYFTSSPDNKAPYDAVPYEIDPTVKNQAAVATGDPNFIQAAALQKMVPAGAIDYGPITRQIQVLFHQGEVATHFEYVADTSPLEEHTLTHGVPPVVSKAAFSCDGGGGAAGDSEGALAAVTAVGRELPFTAASSPLTLALLGSAGLGIGLGLEAARRRRRRRRA
jgi:YVTN family beta-propeller protein